MEPVPALWLTFLVAALLHTSAGFGAALVAMAALVPIIGLATAAPLVALVVMTLQMLIALRYRDKLVFSTLRPLLLALILGTPIGIWSTAWLSEEFLLTLLGLLILTYVAINLVGTRPVRVDARRRWGFLIGVLAGTLSGAYNVGGPLIVMYLQARGYAPDMFRANLQAAFIAGTLFVLVGHLLRGTFTTQVFEYYALALPAIVLGFAAGLLLARRIPLALFRTVVLALLAVLGLQLLLR